MNIINRLRSEQFFETIDLHPSLIIHGINAEVESIVLVQIIAIVEEILEEQGSSLDLFDEIFSSNNDVTLQDLDRLIDK